MNRTEEDKMDGLKKEKLDLPVFPYIVFVPERFASIQRVILI
jgi:hypothetical protein